MQSSRRDFLTTLALAPVALRTVHAANDRVHLIAHRGGVVDADHPENSPLSVEAAIERGYWMLEVDIRRTRDGVAILQHDATFHRFYGDARKVADLTWREVQQLRATPGGTRPMSVEELCARCAGRVRLMLDIKVNADATDDFYQGLIETLRRHRLLETTYSLNAGRLPALTDHLVPEAASRKVLTTAIEHGEPVSGRRFLFESGTNLDSETLRLCKVHDVVPVAAFNVFAYNRQGDDHMRVVENEARQLLALGVRHFQIDSVYERFLTR